MDSTQNIISFCTGYGGIELGLRRAGVDVRVVCNVEIEAFVQANLVAKIEEGLMDDAPIYTDLKTFPAEIFRGKIHGIIGGYPCQPFSSAGKRKGEKDPRHLWPYIRDHVRAVRPLWCFFENVRGHTTMGLWRVLSDLEEDGYRTEWGLYSAEETGAPHQRIRCFILAYRGGLGSTPGISGQIAGQEGQSEEFNHDSGGQLVNPASEGLEGCARESVQGRSEGSARTNGAELGDTQHDGLHGDSFSGGSEEASKRSEEGKKASRQSEGASGQEDLRHLQGAELRATPRGGTQVARSRGTGGKILAEEAKIHASPAPEKSSTSGKNQGSWPTARSSDAEGGRIKTEQTEKGFRSKREKSDHEWEELTGAEMNKPPAMKLNPNWVEQLMGLPIGWTDLGSWATESSHKPQN